MSELDGVFLAVLASMAFMFLLAWVRIEWFQK